ncbi:MAG: chemotaxis protein CheA [Hydrogenophilales bacterium CG17_big_fil_post_rev_8_21_14_2_50_63_12]|nr:MAG: chemotaxis protein CheA [Hydrogenophilales bacterium CG17_big_fil_post_rev_8_21_14_2_50_63_12]PIX97451.1 MAG: chemotaxis protein CheA [Hydrogenophilales bacterium CG_4_10_14_3_um_filter_63_21]PJB03482.1 MAG: chemotaxis protein CheA [Hydrogenophilales bacterium CG_4_9_14_3_um_filter_63_34]
MEELLSDFLLEAGDMLSDVDSKLMELEKRPSDGNLLNEIFRGFHTIKGGAGFLNANELVTLCHLTENLFDKLRTNQLTLDAELLDAIFAATAEVRLMFSSLQQNQQPTAAPADILAALQSALEGKAIAPVGQPKPVAAPTGVGAAQAATSPVIGPENVDWDALYKVLTGTDIVETVGATRDPAQIKQAIDEEESTRKAFGRRTSDVPGATVGRRGGDVPAAEAKETTIRVDTVRLDQVLNLSGEIGLTKNRLTHLRSDLLQGRSGADILRELDLSVTQLDMLVVNLQNAVMKTRMQPIGRLFKKYPRLARDLARSLGKDVELVLTGEETEMDKTMIEDLNDPLVHLVRNAVDHGVETIEGRRAAGKPEKSVVELSAHQEGDHILITISDDGKGMRPEMIRSKAIEKGLITSEMANTLDENQCLELILLPGFSTKDEISSVSGRGVGMDVVKTNIEKLNGSIQIHSEPGKGSTFSISLPLTLAILPVLVLRLGDQSFAVPLSMVREILPVTRQELQQISGKATMVVRGEVLPVLPLTQLIGWGNNEHSEVGVLMQFGSNSFILTADGFVGHEDVVIKSLDTFRPKGVAGVTMSSEGDIVLILDIKELLSDMRGN